MFRVDEPRSEPRVLHELTQKKMAEDAESDIAIRFVDETTKERLLLKLCQRTEIKKESPLLSCIELTVQQGNP